MLQDHALPPLGDCLTDVLSSNARLVFVYGTLRQGGANDITDLSPKPCFIATGRVRGRLFDLGAYPGLILGGEAYVTGEIYAIAPALEQVLDEIEEVWPQRSGEYMKKETLVYLDRPLASGLSPLAVKAERLRCMFYELNPARVSGRRLIASGDWMAHVKQGVLLA